MLYVQFWAPDDGRKNRLKHVEHFTERNKLWNAASCCLYSANILAMHGLIMVNLQVNKSFAPAGVQNSAPRTQVTSLVSILAEIYRLPDKASTTLSLLKSYSTSASYKIPRIFWNPKVPHSPPLVPILPQENPIHAPDSISWTFLLILYFHVCIGLPSRPFPSTFPTKPPNALLRFSIPTPAPRAKCPTHYIHLNWLPRWYLAISTDHKDHYAV